MDDVVTFFAAMTFWHWFALGGVLLILEIFTPTFYLIWPGIAAVVVGIIALVAPELRWEIDVTIFGVMSLVAIVVWHGFYKRGGGGAASALALNQRTERYIGRRAIVAEGFRSGRGPVLLEDTRWQAVSESGADLAPGSSVEIVGADGVTLRVRPA